MRKTIDTSDRLFKVENLLQNVIIPQIVNTIGHAYPELDKQFVKICEIFAHEDHLYRARREKNRTNFKTLDMSELKTITEDDVVDFAGFPSALRDIEKQMASNTSMTELSVSYAFDRLYGNFGLNEDLIEKLAEEKGLAFDSDGFVQYKRLKKSEAKATMQYKSNELLDRLSALNHLAQTDCSFKYDYRFDDSLGQYVIGELQAQVLYSTSTDDHAHHIILDRTNFYHTAGGQYNDIGQIISADGKVVFNVDSVQSHKGLVIHSGHFANDHQQFVDAQNVKLFVDASNRTKLTQHHSCMHLLQAAMKQITGQVVFQQSSNVTADSLKCTLGSIGKQIDAKKIAAIEQLVSDVIQAKAPVQIDYYEAHELYALNDLTTIPGVIYPDRNVRVLKMIVEAQKFASIEPCCGTHAKNTSELQAFCFKHVKGDNQGLYEIEAVCGELVDELRRQEKSFLVEFDRFMARTANKNEWNVLPMEANRLKLFLYNNQIPYLTKEKCLADIVKAEKIIRATQKSDIHGDLVAQMLNVLDGRTMNNESFIVHVLDTEQPLEESSVAGAMRVCEDLPALILNVSDGQIVAGRANIPLKFANKEFNTKHWLDECVGALGLKSEPAVKKELYFSSRLTKKPRHKIDGANLDMAVARAKAVAKETFSERVDADAINRRTEQHEILSQIKSIKEDVHENNHSLKGVFELDARTRNMQTILKRKLLLFTFKEQCSNDLVEISHQIQRLRQEMEKYATIIFVLSHFKIIHLTLFHLNFTGNSF